MANRHRHAGRPPKLVRDWGPTFLGVLEATHSIRLALKQAEVSLRTVYRARKASPKFREAWDEIRASIVEGIEETALKRAYDGWVEIRYDREGQPYKVRQYDHKLMLRILSQWKPDRYREKGHPQAAEEKPNEEDVFE